jgi:hypothetical protein
MVDSLEEGRIRSRGNPRRRFGGAGGFRSRRKGSGPRPCVSREREASGRLEVQRFANTKSLAKAVRDFLAADSNAGEWQVFLQDSESRGVYRVGAPTIAAHAADLLVYDGSCVFFGTETGTAGFLVDYETDAAGVCYELEYWRCEAVTPA